MELSKDLPIFSIINEHLQLLNNNDTYELEVNFLKKDGHFVESDFNNFTNVFRSLKYDEKIESECLEASCDSDVMLLSGMPNILQHCKSDAFDKNNTTWIKSRVLQSNDINDTFDFNVSITLYNKTPSTIPDKWDDVRKKYVLRKYIKYTCKGSVKCVSKDADEPKNSITYIASMFKTSDDEFYTFRQSNIMKDQQNYAFKIVFRNDTDENAVIQAIIRVMQAISMSSMLLTKGQQQAILDEYYAMVKKDIEISYYNKKTGDIPLLTPKPVTLERTNLINPKEYGAVSILTGYTVTEKADGERILMYVDGKGKVYLINNTYRVEDTGLVVSQAAYNSLIDGEYIQCNKRKDDAINGLFAAFDIYYVGGKCITALPLIDENNKDSRYKYLQQFAKLVSKKSGTNALDFTVKEHKYSDDILKDCKNILMTANAYPYDIDGLIFTPAKLALYSYYTNNPVKLTDNVKWDRVFKWKPDEQNTIDFLVKIDKNISKNGLKYKEAKLYVGYNASQWEDIDIQKGLKLRYDKEFAKQNRPNQQSYVPVLFRPTVYYVPGLEYAHIRQNSRGELRAENGDKIETDSIVEFRYINDISIPVNERWRAVRVRDDKTRIFRKGILSKTANELGVALNIWRSIHNPVTNAMIIGNEPVYNKEASDLECERLLDTDDVYYSRNIPRDYLLSLHMLNFHNQGIKKQLYEKPSKKGSLLELCCGEAGDMNRWLDSGYNFIMGIDLVKNNVYNPRSGCYSRMLKRRTQFMKSTDKKVYFPDMVFATGDCAVPIKNGQSGTAVGDAESSKIMKIVMNRQSSVDSHVKYIAGKGADGFDAISCMFAVHYFFESEQKLDGFLDNVAQNLKKNGVFFCTFMNGDKVEKEIMGNGGDMIEGRKLYTDYQHGMPVWAIIRRYAKDTSSLYGKKIDVYIENTQKLIPEYMVSYKLLVDKAKDRGLDLIESEMFEESFNKLKAKRPESQEDYTHLDQDIIELDKDDIQKQFSFLNQWAIFKKA
jgi:SAM-dependent methyltransferase